MTEKSALFELQVEQPSNFIDLSGRDEEGEEADAQILDAKLQSDAKQPSTTHPGGRVEEIAVHDLEKDYNSQIAQKNAKVPKQVQLRYRK